MRSCLDEESVSSTTEAETIPTSAQTTMTLAPTTSTTISTEQPTTTTETPTTIGWVDCMQQPSPSQNYPVPGNNRKYYVCVIGEPYIMDCLPGMTFQVAYGYG